MGGGSGSVLSGLVVAAGEEERGRRVVNDV